jgi:hypothetical protein
MSNAMPSNAVYGCELQTAAGQADPWRARGAVSQVVKFANKALIDMFSLADIEGIKGAAEAAIEVEGTVDETRKTSRAADATAAAEMDAATAADE